MLLICKSQTLLKEKKKKIYIYIYIYIFVYTDEEELGELPLSRSQTVPGRNTGCDVRAIFP